MRSYTFSCYVHQAHGPKTAEDGKLAWQRPQTASRPCASLNKGLAAAASGLAKSHEVRTHDHTLLGEEQEDKTCGVGDKT